MTNETKTRRLYTEKDCIRSFTSHHLSELFSSASNGSIVFEDQFEGEPRGIVRIIARRETPGSPFHQKPINIQIDAAYRFSNPDIRIAEGILYDSDTNALVSESRGISKRPEKTPESEWLGDYFFDLKAIPQEKNASVLRTILPYVITQLEKGSNELEGLSKKIQKVTEKILQDYGVKPGDLDDKSGYYWLPGDYLGRIAKELKIRKLVDAEIFGESLYGGKSRPALQGLLKRLQD